MNQVKEPKTNRLDPYRPTIEFSSLLNFVVLHPGLAVFIVYAIIASAGFVYVVTFYKHFDLDVMVYLEIGDILVAGIKDPMVMLMVLGSFAMLFIIWLLVYVQAPLSAWLDRKFSKGFFKFIPYIFGVKSVRSFWGMSLIAALLYFVIFIAFHSENKANSIKNDQAYLVTVQAEALKNNTTPYSLLGTSINYIFLYNQQQKNTLIIPIENVTSLKPGMISEKQMSVQSEKISKSEEPTKTPSK